MSTREGCMANTQSAICERCSEGKACGVRKIEQQWTIDCYNPNQGMAFYSYYIL